MFLHSRSLRESRTEFIPFKKMNGVNSVLLLSLAMCFAGVSSLHAQALAPAHFDSTPEKLNLQMRQQADSVPANNQTVARAIAARLRQSSSLKNYKIDITFQDGRLELTGQVSDRAQSVEAERLAHTVPGVQSVVNHLQVASASRADLLQAQILQPPPIEGPSVKFGGKPGEEKLPPTTPPPPEPTPVYQGHPPGAAPNAHYPPRMPPYAWPTYAPYNNYSRVAYPTLYPYKSWPFIGPMYPFPKVPLGWRSVSLTWQDGFWWYGRNATGRNWWQTRFW